MKNDINWIDRHIANLFRARFPILYIPTWEEGRVIELLSKISKNESLIKTKRALYVWSQTKGMFEHGYLKAVLNTETAIKALEFVEQCTDAGIFVFKDFHIFFGIGNKQPDYTVIRKVRDLSYFLKQDEQPKNIVFISPMIVLPEELQKDITIIDFDLPQIYEIRNLLEEMIEVNQVGGKIQIRLTESEKNYLSKSALGLTLQEAENAFARAMVENGRLTIDELAIIMDEKCQVIKKTEILEFVKSDLKATDIGGLGNLKKWLSKRSKSWSESALKYNLPSPKGILITGVPGCGKSLTAKAISAMWELPLLRLDMGKVFSGIIGSSEENMRKAIKVAEAVSPSILWIDEIEKGFNGATGANGDSGTSSRVFGTFLTWLQEKTLPVFVVATANDISVLPSELLRKGRFDEIFFVDLPTFKERVDIFYLHLKKRLSGLEVCQLVSFEDEKLLHSLAMQTEGFSGAEIEQIVIAALFEAFSEDRPLEVTDLNKVIVNMVPLSITQSEQIISLRNWANIRAVAATPTDDRNEYQSQYKLFSTGDEDANEGIDNIDIMKKSRGGRSIDF